MDRFSKLRNLATDSVLVPCKVRLSVPVPPWTLPPRIEPVSKVKLCVALPLNRIARPPVALAIVPLLVIVPAPVKLMPASVVAPLLVRDLMVPELTTVPPPSTSIAEPPP